MCGIFGIASREPLSEGVLSARFRDAMRALGHRGPDARGEHRHRNVWLGHLRLSILDLSEHGAQPMRSADGRWVISYNGEIYNFRELASKWPMSRLRSHSDTEVVLESFAAGGVTALRELNGMFAFALHDTREDKLWLARDRVGIKPLYYLLTDDALVFGSEVKALLALSGNVPQCDLTALHEWVYFGNALGGRTFYDGIRQLAPGHYLKVDTRTFQHEEKAYWTLEHAACIERPEEPEGADVVSRTRSLLEEAVRRQLVSDVPVGVFLSGGIDSSAITAFASRHYPGRLTTFSASFDFTRHAEELPKASRVAAQFGTEHHELHVAGADIRDVIQRLVDQHDAPFGDAANIPLYLMARELHGLVKVVLQGDGGDELFGGYRRYSTIRHRNLLHPLTTVVQPLLRLMPDSALRTRVHRYVHAFAESDVAMTMARLLSPEDVSSLPTTIFGKDLSREITSRDPFVRHRECQRSLRRCDLASQMALLDILITLPDLFLEKVDRATMAASVEVRVPFLDNDLVEFAVGLSSERKMPRGRRKGLLKEGLRGIVPSEVLEGPKVGLEVPFAAWLRGTLKPFFLDHLAAFERRHAGVLDGARVRKLHAQLEAGRDDHKYLLWKTLNLMVWGNGNAAALRFHQ